MGLRSIFGGGSSHDTFGKAGTEAQERKRREKIERTGHASAGPDLSRDEIISMPDTRRKRR